MATKGVAQSCAVYTFQVSGGCIPQNVDAIRICFCNVYGYCLLMPCSASLTATNKIVSDSVPKAAAVRYEQPGMTAV